MLRRILMADGKHTGSWLKQGTLQNMQQKQGHLAMSRESWLLEAVCAVR